MILKDHYFSDMIPMTHEKNRQAQAHLGSIDRYFQRSRILQLFIDADACPRAIKDIVYRAVTRVKRPLVMITNQSMSVPNSSLITLINVAPGFDAADDKIVELVQPGDLVITADIPLADRVVSKDAYALDPRGAFHTKETIKQRLAVRNLMDHLRSNGTLTGGPATFNQKDRKAFADQLDKFIAKH